MFFKVMAWDGEMLPDSVDRMPSPDKCPVILISCHFNSDYIIEGNKTRNVVLVLTKNYQNVEIQKDRVVYYFNDEVKKLNKFIDIIKDYNPDVITGFNSNGWDFPYIFNKDNGRCKTLGMRNINIGLGDSNIYTREHLSDKGMKVVSVNNVTGRIIFDVLYLLRREDESNVFKKKYNLKSQTLEHVSKEILGIEKLDFPIQDMINYWKDTDNVELRNKFIDYCSRDSELALLLFTKHRLLDKFMSLAKASGKLVQEIVTSMGSGMMVENSLLREFRKNDRLIPVRVRKEAGFKAKELEGAEVAEPVLGVSENVVSTDYKSLYPSLMIKYNLCYSTLILEKDISKLGLTENDVETIYDDLGNPIARFVRKEKCKGIVPIMLERLMLLRASQKKEMKKYEKGTPGYLLYDSSQNGTKILLNSFYGYSGDVDAKVYSWYVASAVTTTGRRQIKKTWHMIIDEIAKVKVGEREFKFKIAMGDTDSSYVQVLPLDGNLMTRDEAVKSINIVLEKVNSTLEKPMSLDFENYIKRIIVVAKKRYAMLTVDDKGKEIITSKGIETIRRDWCNFTTDNMSKVVDLILKESKIEDGIKKSIEITLEQAKLLDKNKVDVRSLVLSNKLTKPIMGYTTKEAHVEVAIKMKERGHPSEVGDRIQFVILDNGKKLISEKAEEALYVIKNPDKCKIDKNYYLHSQLLSPLIGSPTRTGILQLLGVKKEAIISRLDEKQLKLDRWF